MLFASKMQFSFLLSSHLQQPTMWTNVLFAVFLSAVSLFLVLRHAQVHRESQSRELEEREREYLSRQHRRRMQASGIIGAVGLLIAGGIWVRGPFWLVAHWGAVILLVFWMLLLAIVDIVITRQYFHSIRKDQVVEHARLQAELDRIRNRNSNGRPRDGDNET